MYLCTPCIHVYVDIHTVSAAELRLLEGARTNDVEQVQEALRTHKVNVNVANNVGPLHSLEQAQDALRTHTTRGSLSEVRAGPPS